MSLKQVIKSLKEKKKMLVEIWGIKNCATMKKAFDYLSSHQIEYLFHDYKKETVTTEWLEQILITIPIEQLLNKKSATWRSLSEVEKQQSNDKPQVIKLMQAHPTLIKRPILGRNKTYLVGFSESSYQQFFETTSV